MVLAGCVGCGHEGVFQYPDSTLASIDSLLWTQPDSAFAQLQAFDESHEVDSLDTFNRHYFHLLLSELLYKNGYAQTNRNELLQAESYYDSLMDAGGNRVHPDLVFLDARSHYINGVGYYEMDSVVPACGQYLKAVEVMENRFSEEELVGKKAKFLALSYSHLCELFSDHYLHEQAIVFGKPSLSYYHKYCAEPWHVSWMLDEIGSQYDMMKQWDSAYCYYQKAYRSLPDTTELVFRDVKTHLLLFSSKEGLMEPQDVLFQLHTLLSSVESEREYCSRCLTIGDVLYSIHQLDSAWVYLIEAYERAASIGVKKQAAEWLVDICKIKGNDSDILEYSSYLASFANQEENQSSVKTQLTKLYSDYEGARQFDLRHQRIGVMRKWGRSAFFAVCVLSLGLGIIYVLNRRKYILSENEWKGESAQQSAKLEEINSKIKRLQEENKEMKETLSETKHSKAPAQEYENLLREEICITISERMERAKKYSSYNVKDYKACFLSQKECADLFRVIDSHCPDFSRRLNKLFPSLNNNDIKLCRFYLLGLSVLQTAILLDTDYSSIRKRTIRLEEKMGDRNLHQLIKSLFFDS